MPRIHIFDLDRKLKWLFESGKASNRKYPILQKELAASLGVSEKTLSRLIRGHPDEKSRIGVNAIEKLAKIYGFEASWSEWRCLYNGEPGNGSVRIDTFENFEKRFLKENPEAFPQNSTTSAGSIVLSCADGHFPIPDLIGFSHEILHSDEASVTCDQIVALGLARVPATEHGDLGFFGLSGVHVSFVVDQSPDLSFNSFASTSVVVVDESVQIRFFPERGMPGWRLLEQHDLPMNRNIKLGDGGLFTARPNKGEVVIEIEATCEPQEIHFTPNRNLLEGRGVEYTMEDINLRQDILKAKAKFEVESGAYSRYRLANVTYKIELA